MRRCSTRKDRLLADLAAEEAVSHRFPPAVIDHALSVTATWLSSLRTDEVTRRRVAAYFGAVARRRVLRGHAGTSAAARLVAEAVVADLIESGRDAASVADELERGWGQSLPRGIIDEYRHRLCA